MSLVGYFQRSLKYLGKQAKQGIIMIHEALELTPKHPMESILFQFNDVNQVQDWLIGTDADIGGYSEAFWGYTPQKTALFWGTISTKVPSGSGLDKSGYAGIRSKQGPLTCFHKERIDCSMFRYLEIKAKGDKNQWMINIQTESLYPSIIWQHKLFFRNPGEWETIRIPFRDFVRTSHGFVQKKQIYMDKSKIKTIGFSILSQPGEFTLELESIRAMNTKDTFGDYDILSDAEYIDDDGNLRKKNQYPPVKWFP